MTMMYTARKVLVGDEYIRTCGGHAGDTIDVLITESGRVAVELGNWQSVIMEEI